MFYCEIILPDPYIPAYKVEGHLPVTPKELLEDTLLNTETMKVREMRMFLYHKKLNSLIALDIVEAVHQDGSLEFQYLLRSF